MAGVLEPELLGQIHSSISRFSDTESILASDTSFNRSPAEHSGKQLSEQFLQEEINRLQREVEMLEDDFQYHDKLMPTINNKQLEKIIKKLLKAQAPVEKTQTDLDHITHLEKEIALQANFTGVIISSTTSSILTVEAERMVRQHEMIGSVGSSNFTLQFDVTESKTDDRVKSAITKLKITLDDSLQTELADVWESLEEDCAIQLFFRILVPYTDWCRQREKAFLYFKQKYSNVVTLPGGPRGNVLKVYCEDKPGAEWMIKWNISVTESGKVFPDFNVTMNVPSQMLKMDKAGVLEQVPTNFYKLLKQYGVSKALTVFIEAVTQ